MSLVVDPKGIRLLVSYASHSRELSSTFFVAIRDKSSCSHGVKEDRQYLVNITNELILQVPEYYAKMGWYKGDRKCQSGHSYNLSKMDGPGLLES